MMILPSCKLGSSGRRRRYGYSIRSIEAVYDPFGRPAVFALVLHLSAALEGEILVYNDGGL